MKQLLISVGREFGSGGHTVAEKLAEKFNIPLYDEQLITEIAEKMGLSEEVIEKYNERPKHKLMSSAIMGGNQSLEESIAKMQFDFLKNKAEKGESFVVVGRCSETVLKEYPALVSVFILADHECKTERVMEYFCISKEKAQALIEQKDKERKAYHNYYCTLKWGDSRLYDLCINSSRLGIDKTADFVEFYIKEKIKD
ncbi:MAG: cytidylate kinase-like family protein [Ruminococcus sp.]|nr:cytidylate kinase-like family protein [Ruminococcus sp.]